MTPTITLLRKIVTSVVIIGIIILAAGGYFSFISNKIVEPAINLQTWISTRYLAVKDLFSGQKDVEMLRQTNLELENEVTSLQNNIIDLKNQLAEVHILSALLNFARGKPGNQYLAATVIGKDPNPFMQYIIIDRGTDDGIQTGMPVVTQKGLVGRINAVIANASRVQLITDPNTDINVVIKPSNTEAILSGSITGNIGLDFIPQDAIIQLNNLILTSGLGGGYPEDIMIGQITGIHKKDVELFQSATVQPIVDFNNIKIVLVIMNFKPLDITPLIPPELP